MYDAGKIVPGLVIFAALMTFPIWYNGATGQGAAKPDPQIVTQEKQCVAATAEMRTAHMQFLDAWRTQAVREGNRTYQAADGATYKVSLTGTCMDCHPNKSQFCDKCHNYAGAKPNCFDCHVAPKENN